MEEKYSVCVLRAGDTRSLRDEHLNYWCCMQECNASTGTKHTEWGFSSKMERTEQMCFVPNDFHISMWQNRWAT